MQKKTEGPRRGNAGQGNEGNRRLEKMSCGYCRQFGEREIDRSQQGRETSQNAGKWKTEDLRGVFEMPCQGVKKAFSWEGKNVESVTEKKEKK